MSVSSLWGKGHPWAVPWRLFQAASGVILGAEFLTGDSWRRDSSSRKVHCFFAIPSGKLASCRLWGKYSGVYVSRTPAKPESAKTASTAVRAAATSSSTDVPPTVGGPKGNGPWEGSQLGSGHTPPYLHRCLQARGYHVLGLFTSWG